MSVHLVYGVFLLQFLLGVSLIHLDYSGKPLVNPLIKLPKVPEFVRTISTKKI